MRRYPGEWTRDVSLESQEQAFASISASLHDPKFRSPRRQPTGFPSVALSYGYAGSTTQRRFAHLGRLTLCQNPLDQTNMTESVWRHMVPQLCQTSPALSAAVASFGASYEINMLQPNPSPELCALGIKQYVSSMQQVRAALASDSGNRITIMLACVILCTTSLLYRREWDA